MTDSQKWALSKLERANQIFEPHEKPGWRQFLNFVIWAAELVAIWLAVHYYWK